MLSDVLVAYTVKGQAVADKDLACYAEHWVKLTGTSAFALMESKKVRCKGWKKFTAERKFTNLRKLEPAAVPTKPSEVVLVDGARDLAGRARIYCGRGERLQADRTFIRDSIREVATDAEALERFCLNDVVVFYPSSIIPLFGEIDDVPGLLSLVGVVGSYKGQAQTIPTPSTSS